MTNKFDSILHNQMTAYGKTHSCKITFVRLVEDWKKVIDQRELVCVLSTDTSKAFDLLSPWIIKKMDRKLMTSAVTNCDDEYNKYSKLLLCFSFIFRYFSRSSRYIEIQNGFTVF